MLITPPLTARRRLLSRLLPGVVVAALVPFAGLIAAAVSTVYGDTRQEIDSRLDSPTWKLSGSGAPGAW